MTDFTKSCSENLSFTNVNANRIQAILDDSKSELDVVFGRYHRTIERIGYDGDCRWAIYSKWNGSVWCDATGKTPKKALAKFITFSPFEL